MTCTHALIKEHASNTQMVVWKDNGNTIVSISDSKNDLTHMVSFQEETTA